MSSMPAGWSVDVDGQQVIVCVSGRPDDRFVMSAQEARTLRNQLHFAYLVAWRESETDSGSATDPESNSTAGLPAAPPPLDEVDELPADWRIANRGQSVEVVVRASAADGEFTLSAQEAFAAGRALIFHAGRARLAWLEARKRAIESTSGGFPEAFPPGYLDDEREGWAE